MRIRGKKGQALQSGSWLSHFCGKVEERAQEKKQVGGRCQTINEPKLSLEPETGFWGARPTAGR